MVRECKRVILGVYIEVYLRFYGRYVKILVYVHTHIHPFSSNEFLLLCGLTFLKMFKTSEASCVPHACNPKTIRMSEGSMLYFPCSNVLWFTGYLGTI